MEKRFKVAELFLAVTLTTAIGACSQPNAPAGGEAETTTPVETQSPEAVTPTPTESPATGDQETEGGEGGEDGGMEQTQPPTDQPADTQNDEPAGTETPEPNQPADNEGGEGGEG